MRTVKKRIILLLSGACLVLALFFFGRLSAPKETVAPTPQAAPKSFDIQGFITESKQKLSSSQSLYLTTLEQGITRGDVASQQLTAYQSLAAFWKDSAVVFEPYAYYLSEAAKLENSEKNLNFAAQLILDNLRSEPDEAKLNWKTGLAISLFEKAIELNPDNDDLRIGLGSSYIFGRGRSGNPQETMKGIQELLAVSRKDPNNMKAQLMLGVGGFISGQYDKAVERLKTVVEKEPGNLEAIAFLADTYAAKGDKAEAVKWYKISKRLVNNPHYSEEVDQRIQELSR